MASSKNKLAFLSMPAPASYVAGLGRGCVFSISFQCQYSLFAVPLVSPHDLISVLPVKVLLPKLLRMPCTLNMLNFPLTILNREAQAKRGEEAEVDPDQFQDPDNEYGLFAGTTYEQDDEEADKIYEQVDENMDARRRARRCVLSG
jgi:pre-mRNA-processing factor 6